MFSVASEARIALAGVSRGEIETRGVVMATAARQRAEISVCYTRHRKLFDTKLGTIVVVFIVFLLTVLTYICRMVGWSLTSIFSANTAISETIYLQEYANMSL